MIPLSLTAAQTTLPGRGLAAKAARGAWDRELTSLCTRRVLIVHYHFLPVHNVAVKRLLGYARWLPTFGWQTSCLTMDWRGIDQADPSWGLTWEPELEKGAGFPIHHVADPGRRDRHRAEVPGAEETRRRGGEVAGTHSGNLAHKLLGKGARMRRMLLGPYPDEFITWVDPAVTAGLRIARGTQIDAVLSYCPPETNHLVARQLARRLGVPWVAFFGDLWGFFLEQLPRFSVERLLRRAFHAWCLAPAAACVAVSPQMVAYLERTYRKRVEMILTGFDPEEFPAEPEDGGPRGDRLVVSHVGSVYPGDQQPELFFDGLDRFLESHPEAEERIEVRFVGSKCDAQLRALCGGRASSRVCRILPSVDSATAVSMVRASHGLLAFTCSAFRDRYGTLSYPTKVFEAFGARRPILAVPADGDWVDTLLATTNGGTGAHTPDDVAAVLRNWFSSWSRTGHVPYHGRPEAIAAFTRNHQAERLAALLDSVCRARVP